MDLPAAKRAGNQATGAPFATRPLGAAGILLSAAGARELGASLLTPACPWPSHTSEPSAQAWDVVLGRCAWARGVPQMHSRLMQPTMDGVLGKSWHFDGNAAPLESMITAAPGGTYMYLRADSTVGDSMASLDAALTAKYDPAVFPASRAFRRRRRRRRR